MGDEELRAADFMPVVRDGVAGVEVHRFIRAAGLIDLLVHTPPASAGRAPVYGWCPRWLYLLGVSREGDTRVGDALLWWRTAQRAAGDPVLAAALLTAHELGGPAAVVALVIEHGAPGNAQGAGP